MRIHISTWCRKATNLHRFSVVVYSITFRWALSIEIGFYTYLYKCIRNYLTKFGYILYIYQLTDVRCAEKLAHHIFKWHFNQFQVDHLKIQPIVNKCMYMFVVTLQSGKFPDRNPHRNLYINQPLEIWFIFMLMQE